MFRGEKENKEQVPNTWRRHCVIENSDVTWNCRSMKKEQGVEAHQKT